MSGIDVAQPETWDDSALLVSWNEAFAEYKKYHSLAAKGEKINVANLRAETALVNGDAQQHVEVKPEPIATTKASSSGHMNAGSERPEELAPPAQPAAATSNGVGGLAMPQALMATVTNEDMKNVMMSWYYAGYYTGLYEGKQQGYALAQDKQQTG